MKKIIAREILILLCAIGIGILCFLGTFGYNLFNDSEIKHLKSGIDTLQKQSDDLDYIFDYKRRNHLWFFQSMVKETNADLSGKIKTEGDYWNYLVNANVFGKIDTVRVRWNGKWQKSGITVHFKNIGFSTPQKLNNFVVEKSMTLEDSLNHKKSIQILKRLNQINEQSANLNYYSKLDSVEQKQFGMQCFEFACILLFGLRYLYYLIKWCLVTLKNN